MPSFTIKINTWIQMLHRYIPLTVAQMIFFLQLIFSASLMIQRSHNSTSLTFKPLLLYGAYRLMLPGSLNCLINGVFCPLLEAKPSAQCLNIFGIETHVSAKELSLCVPKKTSASLKCWCVFISLNFWGMGNYAADGTEKLFFSFNFEKT